MPTKQIKLYQQKFRDEPFGFDEHNQKMFDAFEAQAPKGCWQVSYKLDIPPKTLEQIRYWYGGIVGGGLNSNGMVEQLLERGDNILGHKTYLGKEIPILVNKDNCDDCLKAFYMISIGRAGQKFTKGNSNIDEMSKLIDWALDYLPQNWGVYVMSSEEYKRLKGG